MKVTPMQLMAVEKCIIDLYNQAPVSGKWNLAKNYLDYYYSSARFYETGVDEFGFLNNLFHGD